MEKFVPGILVSKERVKKSGVVVPDCVSEFRILKRKTGKWFLFGKHYGVWSEITSLSNYNVSKILGENAEEVYYEVIYGVRPAEEFS